MKLKINRAYKTEMKPTKRQLDLLNRSAGVARFAYNWGLARRIEEYQTAKKSSNAIEQHKQLNAIKKTDFPWMYEVSKCCPQNALRNLDEAYKHFFRRVKEGQKPGFPRFKRKHDSKQSFRLNGSIQVMQNCIKLPRIGCLRLKEKGYLPVEDVKILNATVSKQAERWFVSINVEEEIEIDLPTNNTVIGIDLGVKSDNLAVLSTGQSFSNPRALRFYESRLKRLQREVSRRIKGSNNRRKSITKLQKLHYRISCIRTDNIHKATTQVVKTKPFAIMLEDLSVQNMKRNHKLSKSINDASMSEFRRQIEYKSLWNGVKVGHVDQFYPSSKTCSNCGYVNPDLKLSDRIFTCKVCGFSINRDLNASINIKNQVGKVLPELTPVERM